MSKQGALILLFVILYVLVVSALSGCEHTVYQDRPVEVKIPVPVNCVQPGDTPAPMIYPVDQLTSGDSDGEIVGALLADHYQRAATEQILRDIIDACTSTKREEL
jgi:hypothetical protein